MPVTKTTKARRRTIGMLRSMARISEHHAILSLALTRWAVRDDHQAQPGTRQAADTAMDAITAICNQLADLRSALIQQIAVSDAAAAVRTLAVVERSRPAGADASDVATADASSQVLADASAPVNPDASAAAAGDASGPATA